MDFKKKIPNVSRLFLATDIGDPSGLENHGVWRQNRPGALQ